MRDGRALLTPLLPPRSHSQWYGWTARQATSRDDCFGVQQHGARVKVERLLQMDFLAMDLRVDMLESRRYK